MPVPLRILYRNRMLEHHDNSLSLIGRIWRAIALFAFRQWGNNYRGQPVGLPGLRDPLLPCLAYNPRPPDPSATPRCIEPDQHYLCERCAEHPKHQPHSQALITLSLNHTP